jgi:5-methylcytosine-specific restriction endonuclease McrA
MATKKQIKEKKPKAPKTRNSGKWTESQFWSFIRSTLRSKSRWWLPILEAKKNSRRPYVGDNKRQKWEYQCKSCSNWFNDKEVAVDHIIPVGTLKSAQDLPFFVENLFCDVSNLQLLCSECHSRKTLSDKEILKNK